MSCQVDIDAQIGRLYVVLETGKSGRLYVVLETGKPRRLYNQSYI